MYFSLPIDVAEAMPHLPAEATAAELPAPIRALRADPQSDSRALAEASQKIALLCAAHVMDVRIATHERQRRASPPSMAPRADAGVVFLCHISPCRIRSAERPVVLSDFIVARAPGGKDALRRLSEAGAGIPVAVSAAGEFSELLRILSSAAAAAACALLRSNAQTSSP